MTYAPRQLAIGVLPENAEFLFASLADSWSIFRRASDELRDGLTHETALNGRVAKPEVAIRKQALADIRAIAGEFGMSPSTITRLRVPKAPDADRPNPLADLLRRRRAAH